MYSVPRMTAIRRIPWNSFKVVSTFSGAGGSCLGYRMAGFHVVWANEFLPAAQETYRANHPGTLLNCDNIRDVTAEDIIKESGIPRGQIDLFDGSPPCSSFSMAGARERHWGEVKKYGETVEQTDDLFFEYIRLLRDLQPKTFVAENVKGLVQGTAKGYFKQFLKGMQDSGYEVQCRLINAKYLGVPQSRERVIFVGVRKDLAEKYDVHPVFPKPDKSIVTLAEAIRGVRNDAQELKALREELQGVAIGRYLRQLPKNPKKNLSYSNFTGQSKCFNLIRCSFSQPVPTLTQRAGYKRAGGPCHPLENRRFTTAEIRRIQSFPDDFILTGNYGQQWERVARSVPPLMMYRISKAIEEGILCRLG